jgi:membrane fusion protein, hemolysin D
MTAIGTSAREAALKRQGTGAGGRRNRALEEFQGDAVEIENAGPAPIARITLFAAAALILALVAWASLARVDEIVTGRGKVVTSAMNIVLSPLQTSVIRRIDVKPGEIVAAGQPLVELDPTFSRADVAEQRRHKAALDAEIVRLVTELTGHVYVPVVAGATSDQLLQGTLSMFRAEQYHAQLQSYDQHIAQIAAQIKERTSQIEVMRKRLKVLVELEGMRRKLADRGTGSKVDYLDAVSARLEVERAMAEAAGEIVAMRHQMDSITGDRDFFIRKWRAEIVTDLVTARHDDATATEQLNKALRVSALTVLRSPEDAVVLEVADHTAGSVAREADTLVTLVPLHGPKEVEVQVDATDIGHLKTGEATRIKLDAYPYQRYGTLAGTVAVISQDSFSPDRKGDEAEPGRPYYRVRIKLDDRRPPRAPESFRLIPGMTANAEIKAGSRRLISYLLYPLTRGFDESFREP